MKADWVSVASRRSTRDAPSGSDRVGASRAWRGERGEWPAAGELPPDDDPFYRAPSNLASCIRGRILAVRPATPRVNLLPIPVRSWQISFRSNDHLNRPILAVTTVLVPRTPWHHRIPTPLVSFQAAEDSLGSAFAPSYTMLTGKGIGSLTDIAQLAPYLLMGWAVAVPDHEGPHAYFGTGINAGHITLDGIRAVQRFADGGVGPDSPVGLCGYSGGARATGWAAQLQPSYAPELQVVAAAVGGMPADLDVVARHLDGTAFAGFEFAVAQSLARAYPAAGIWSVLNERGRRDFRQMAGKGQSEILARFGFRRMTQDVTVPDPLGVPSIVRVLRINKLGLAGAPRVPVYDYHVETDEVVPVAQDDETVRLWRLQGARVKVVRDRRGEHATEALLRLPSVVAFLQHCFNAAA